MPPPLIMVAPGCGIVPASILALRSARMSSTVKPGLQSRSKTRLEQDSISPLLGGLGPFHDGVGVPAQKYILKPATLPSRSLVTAASSSATHTAVVLRVPSRASGLILAKTHRGSRPSYSHLR